MRAPEPQGTVSRAVAVAPRTGFEVAPPLVGLCALAATCSMALNQVALPVLGTHAAALVTMRVARAGAFFENLAVIAGTIALLAGVLSVVRAGAGVSLPRRAFGLVLLVLLLRAVAIATLRERQDTTSENVYLAVGAADFLCVLCGMAAIDIARTYLARVLAILATSVPLLSMLATTLSVAPDVHLDPWKRHSYDILAALGELSYLALLLASPLAFMPRERTPRALFARSAGFATLGAVLALMHAARSTLQADFGLLVYHAQRVSLLLDRWPFGYALPFAAALAAASSAMIAGGRRYQAGAGVLLVFVSGYAPETPGRLLTMTLGFVLLARAQTLFFEER